MVMFVDWKSYMRFDPLAPRMRDVNRAVDIAEVFAWVRTRLS
jgi:hypothetical protein